MATIVVMGKDDDGFDLSQGLRSICTSVHGANRGKASVRYVRAQQQSLLRFSAGRDIGSDGVEVD